MYMWHSVSGHSGTLCVEGQPEEAAMWAWLGLQCHVAGTEYQIPVLALALSSSLPLAVGPPALTKAYLQPVLFPKASSPPLTSLFSEVLITHTISTAPLSECNCFPLHLSCVSPSLKEGFLYFLSFHLSAPGLALGPQQALAWYILLTVRASVICG